MSYRPGDYYVICDICGGRLLSSQSQKNWEGAVCHANCCDQRHPQETPRTCKDKITVKDARPENEVYLNSGDVTRDDL